MRRSKKPMVAAICILLVAGGIALRRSDMTPLLARAASIAATALKEPTLSSEIASDPATAEPATPPTSLEGEDEASVVTETPATANSIQPPNPLEVEAPVASTPTIATAPIPSVRPAVSPLRRYRPPSKPHSPTGSPTDVDVGF
jgi:hypothetical protein